MRAMHCPWLDHAYNRDWHAGLAMLDRDGPTAVCLQQRLSRLPVAQTQRMTKPALPARCGVPP